MTKKCSHPENRRGFDTGIEWCIDCQAIMDEKGNFVHQTAEATDAPQVLSASAECPLCGHEGPHPHTPLEQVIYRNGVKAGKAHGNEPLLSASFPRVSVAGIPIVIIEDLKMPPDQIELWNSDGQIVRTVGIKWDAQCPVCKKILQDDEVYGSCMHNNGQHRMSP